MNAKDCVLEIVLFLATLISTSLSCHNGCMYKIIVTLFYYFLSTSFTLYIDLYDDFYGSVTVDVGSDATFSCYGDGSYLYWFINGINTENMTAEEIEEMGLSFSGYYNNYPPYYGCDIQYSHMTIAGNCLNNNSEIYCVILGDEPPPFGRNATSSVANLTVNGE